MAKKEGFKKKSMLSFGGTACNTHPHVKRNIWGRRAGENRTNRNDPFSREMQKTETLPLVRGEVPAPFSLVCCQNVQPTFAMKARPS